MTTVIKYYILVLCALFLSPGIAFSQRAIDDLVLMSKKYNAITAYQIDISVKVYKNNSDVKPEFVSVGKNLKSGSKMYLSMLNRKTIVNNELMLVVDDQQKLLMYSGISSDQIAALSKTQLFNIDSLVKKQGLVANYLDPVAGNKRIEIVTKGEDIERTVICYDGKTYALKEVAYYYGTEGKKNFGNSKVIISYPVFSFEVKNPELFNQSKYIIKKGKRVEAVGNYKGYKLISAGDIEKQLK